MQSLQSPRAAVLGIRHKCKKLWPNRSKSEVSIFVEKIVVPIINIKLHVVVNQEVPVY